jgi:hypothetical protein
MRTASCGRGCTVATQRVAIATFYDMITLLLGRGLSLIAELSFRRGLDEPRLRPVGDIATLVNIHCALPTAEAQRRFAARERTRRPVKSAASFIEQMEAGAFDWSPFDPLDLVIPRMIVDTSGDYAPDLASIVAFCLSNHRGENRPVANRLAPDTRTPYGCVGWLAHPRAPSLIHAARWHVWWSPPSTGTACTVHPSSGRSIRCPVSAWGHRWCRPWCGRAVLK